MVGPHHRAGSSGRLCEEHLLVNDLENEDKRKKGSENNKSCHCYISDNFRRALSLVFPSASSKLSDEDNCVGGNSKNQHNVFSGLLKLVLVVSAFLTLFGSLRWMLTISKTSPDYLLDRYWWVQLQEQLMTDISDIKELSLGSSRLKEVKFCSQEYENHVPCFNTSESLQSQQLDRQCANCKRIKAELSDSSTQELQVTSGMASQERCDRVC